MLITNSFCEDPPRQREPKAKEWAYANVVEDRVADLGWYKNYFMSGDHELFAAQLGDEAVVVALRKETLEEGGLFSFRVIIWRHDEIHRLTTVPSSKDTTFQRVLAECDPEIAVHHKSFKKLLPTAKMMAALNTIDMPDPKLVRKIGVLYVKEGQVDENDIFANKHESPAFDEFLDLLGQRVDLKGYKGYAAQLDTRTDIDGTTSVARVGFNGFETMFHVSTLLRFEPKDPQQIQRKRHIGNDIVVVVFVDGTSLFDVGTLVSQYTRAIVVVQANPAEPTKYRLAIASHPDQPPCSPAISRLYDRDARFADLLLTKCYNCERATKMGVEFRGYERRTRRGLLAAFMKEHYETSQSPKKAARLSAAATRIPAPPAPPQILRPTPIIINHRSRITCIDNARGFVFFASAEGVFCCQGDQLCESEKKWVLIMDAVDVLQIKTADKWDALFVLTKSVGVIVFELSSICHVADGAPVVPRCTFVPSSRNAFLFAFGTADGIGLTEPLLYLVKARTGGSCWLEVYDARYKLLHVNDTIPSLVTLCTLTPRGLVLAYGSQFALFKTQSAGISKEALDSRPGEVPCAAFAHGKNFTLCYRRFGVRIALDENPQEHYVSQSMRWSMQALHFGMTGPFLCVVGRTYTEVRSAISGALVEYHAVACSDEFQSESSVLYVPTWHAMAKSSSVIVLPIGGVLEGPLSQPHGTQVLEDSGVPIEEDDDPSDDDYLGVSREVLEENMQTMRGEAKKLELLRRRNRQLEVQLNEQRKAFEVEKAEFYAEMAEAQANEDLNQEEDMLDYSAHLPAQGTSAATMAASTLGNQAGPPRGLMRSPSVVRTQHVRPGGDPLVGFRSFLDAIHLYKEDADDPDSPHLLTNAKGCQVLYSDQIAAALFADADPVPTAQVDDDEVLRVICGCLGGVRAYYQRYLPPELRRQVYDALMTRLLEGNMLRKFEGAPEPPLSALETAVNVGNFKQLMDLISRPDIRTTVNVPLQRHYNIKSKSSSTPILELKEGTCLHLAVVRGRLAAIQLLLKGGVDVEKPGRWQTPDGLWSGTARDLARERPIFKNLSEAARVLLLGPEGANSTPPPRRAKAR